jgi:hypothetical protein
MRTTMKTLQRRLILGLVTCLLPSTAWAQSLGLNFAATDPDAASSSLDPAEVAGVVPQANWNNLADAAGSSESLVLDDGTPSGVSISWSSPNTWRSGDNNAFPEGPDRKLTSGYLDSNDTSEGGVSITVEGLDAALNTPAYDVYVYFVSDSPADRGGGYTIDDGSGPIVKYGSTMGMPSSLIEDLGTDVDNALDGTFLRFSGLTGSSFTLTSDTTLTTPNGFRAPVNAIQVVGVPEPASVVLMGCGALLAGALVWRRRRS